MALPEGFWSSYIRVAPASFPNDGVFVIVEPISPPDFDGFHYRPPFEKTPIHGQFTEATADQPAHIKFTEKYNGVTYEYDADIITFKPNFFVTFKGTRRTVVPVVADEDWAGTHTT